MSFLVLKNYLIYIFPFHAQFTSKLAYIIHVADDGHLPIMALEGQRSRTELSGKTEQWAVRPGVKCGSVPSMKKKLSTKCCN